MFLLWFYLKRPTWQENRITFDPNKTDVRLWEDWDGDNWEREPCFYGSLRLHCSYCCDNILKYYKDCEDKESETVYLLPESCEVCGRDRKISLSEIKLVNFFRTGKRIK